MPIHYQGTVIEHRTVREKMGLFDVSHMGQIYLHGEDAEKLLDYLSVNRISGKAAHTATYTVLCREDGTCVDDVIVYRQDDYNFFIIANAGNRQKDLAHLKAYAQGYGVSVEERFEGRGILALQGPQAGPFLEGLYPAAEMLKPMQWLELNDSGVPLIISRTGYTGAGGFEIYGTDELIISLWDRMINAGIQPIGLGARDTLRLEMGFALYGHELSDQIKANESVSAWTIKWEKQDFLGKNSLIELKESPLKRTAYGIKLLDPGIARQGFPVFRGEVQIGEVTSGSFSPTLNAAIGLILTSSPLALGDVIDVQIRQTRCRAQVVPLPFIRKNG
jgi:aminomethyltransferase